MASPGPGTHQVWRLEKRYRPEIIQVFDPSTIESDDEDYQCTINTRQSRQREYQERANTAKVKKKGNFLIFQKKIKVTGRNHSKNTTKLVIYFRCYTNVQWTGERGSQRNSMGIVITANMHPITIRSYGKCLAISIQCRPSAKTNWYPGPPKQVQ